MADFLSHLLDRALGQASVLERRRPSMFESPAPDIPLGPDIRPVESVAPDRPATLQPAASQPAVQTIREIWEPAPATIVAPATWIAAPNPQITVPPQPQRIKSTRIVERELLPGTVTIDRTREIETIVERRMQTILPAVTLTPAPTDVPETAETPQPLIPEAASRTPSGVESRTIVMHPQLPVPSTIATHTPALPVPIATRPAAPRKEAPLERPRPPEAPAPIHISIGRIEVRAAQPVAATARRARSFAPKLSLDDYLLSRHGGSK
jgi:hypothetical protein